MYIVFSFIIITKRILYAGMIPSPEELKLK